MSDDDADDDITTEQINAAMRALLATIEQLGAEKRDPRSLCALHGLMGALLVRYADYTPGNLLDRLCGYAEDDELMEQIGDVLRDAGVLGPEPLPSEERVDDVDAKLKPN